MSFWQGKRALVTGGCGFIGAFLVRSLLAAGAKVRIADNLERGSIESLGDAALVADIETAHPFELGDLLKVGRGLVLLVGDLLDFDRPRIGRIA